MDLSYLLDACRGEGFIPVPRQIKVDATHSYHECPFCGADCGHYAMVALGTLLDARPIHCHHSGRMAWVLWITPVLRAAEERFRSILKRFDGAEPMTAQEAVKAWHTHGMPLEIAEELVTDQVEFRRLVDEHRARGGNAFAEVYA